MTTHTPGPWLIMGNTVYALKTDKKGLQVNRFWASVWGTQFTLDGEELQANTRLIAAAPDMLAALAAIEKAAESGNFADIVEALTASEEALAKARNQGPSGD